MKKINLRLNNLPEENRANKYPNQDLNLNFYDPKITFVITVPFSFKLWLALNDEQNNKSFSFNPSCFPELTCDLAYLSNFILDYIPQVLYCQTHWLLFCSLNITFRGRFHILFPSSVVFAPPCPLSLCACLFLLFQVLAHMSFLRPSSDQCAFCPSH